jgi:hypothetical protein
MKGSYDRGIFTITWDAQTEKLDAPDGKIYMPCSECSKVLVCEKNTTSIMCPECYDPESPEFIWLDPEDFGLLTRQMYQLLKPSERKGLVKYGKVYGDD